MMISFSDGNPSQYQRIHALLRTYYPLQNDEVGFQLTAAYEQALIESRNPVHYEKWKQYLQRVKAQAKGVLRVSPASSPLTLPALEGIFTLKREKMGRVVYKRKFRVFLSLIGGFYTMFGQDEVLVEAEGAPGTTDEAVSFAPVLYPTPLAIYEKWWGGPVKTDSALR